MLNIYVPAEYLRGEKKGRYTADSAPLIYYNTSGGFTSSKPVTPGMKRQPDGHFYQFLEEGYVLVGIGTRGKETTDAAGVPNGTAPAIIADLKAGIRYLKYNDAAIPGDARRIVSLGFSSGGAVSTLVGATGNSPLYEPYLREIGAAPASDDIFIAVCYCPMANLNIADASYEWYHHGNTFFKSFSSQGGAERSLEGFELALSQRLQRMLVGDLQDRGLDITADGRGGRFYTSFVGLYEEGISGYVRRFCRGRRQARAFLAKLDPDGRWLQWDAKSGKATIRDYAAFDRCYLVRRKGCPSFDAYDYRSLEGTVFGDGAQPKRHFSRMVLEAARSLAGEFPEEAGRYIAQYEPDIDAKTDTLVRMMSAIDFIGDREVSDVAPYWRFRTGSEDGDQGIIAAHILAEALRPTGAAVDEGVIWGLPHTAAEYTFSDLVAYIDACCAAAAGSAPGTTGAGEN